MSDKPYYYFVSPEICTPWNHAHRPEDTYFEDHIEDKGWWQCQLNGHFYYGLSEKREEVPETPFQLIGGLLHPGAPGSEATRRYCRVIQNEQVWLRCANRLKEIINGKA